MLFSVLLLHKLSHLVLLSRACDQSGLARFAVDGCDVNFTCRVLEFKEFGWEQRNRVLLVRHMGEAWELRNSISIRKLM